MWPRGSGVHARFVDGGWPMLSAGPSDSAVAKVLAEQARLVDTDESPVRRRIVLYVEYWPESGVPDDDEDFLEGLSDLLEEEAQVYVRHASIEDTSEVYYIES